MIGQLSKVKWMIEILIVSSNEKLSDFKFCVQNQNFNSTPWMYFQVWNILPELLGWKDTVFWLVGLL